MSPQRGDDAVGLRRQLDDAHREILQAYVRERIVAYGEDVAAALEGIKLMLARLDERVSALEREMGRINTGGSVAGAAVMNENRRGFWAGAWIAVMSFLGLHR